jgi:hypothetical protein
MLHIDHLTENKLHLVSVLARDDEFRRQFRDTIKPKRLGGVFSPEQYLVVEESIKHYTDIYTAEGWALCGVRAVLRTAPCRSLCQS